MEIVVNELAKEKLQESNLQDKYIKLYYIISLKSDNITEIKPVLLIYKDRLFLMRQS